LRRECRGILLILVTGCLLMAIIDGIWQPGYAVKSVWKIVIFLGVPVLYSLKNKDIRLIEVFSVKRKGIVTSILIGIGVYAFILACYFTIGSYFDFSKVTDALSEGVGVTKDNFIFVAIYISFINSLLEEFFFRGFVFLNLSRLADRKFAYIVSSFAFSVYHAAIMTGWFSVWLFALLLFSLMAAGIIFNRLNEKQGNIYTSWFVHMFANFAINTVGVILFKII